ncbi:MAG: hypothetical protein AVO38_06315 [delta proteobacterium ML8_D]|jgi:anti-sigma28 factor (negative regulator of flagellin synthesis)|nr:MAG: hypothetical protein AVO38_06315 [delta proteobacterium ML8_D]
MESGETGRKLAEMIKKAIRDSELTVSEHNKILAIADGDLMIDSKEQNLLKELQNLIANGTIKRVPD